MSYKEIREFLKSRSNQTRAEHEKRYLKTSLRLYGCGIPAPRKAAKLGTEKDIKQLWGSGIFEEMAAAIFLVRPELKNWNLLKSFFKNIDNWALGDWTCSVLAEILAEHPEKYDELIIWTQSDNPWLRRASAVVLAIGVRKGVKIPLNKQLALSDQLMLDKDYFVQMGVGWMLRDLALKYENCIIGRLRKWKGKASQVIIRRAVERLSKTKRKEFVGR
ncbi:MAG: DNA alkylation repair protein [Nanoarchaeota archaeon]|nr:DNA alkylation repair protein [Nanoarchaeota archaeon]